MPRGPLLVISSMLLKLILFSKRIVIQRQHCFPALMLISLQQDARTLVQLLVLLLTFKNLYDKVASWSEEIIQLANFALVQPRAAYAAFTHGLSGHWLCNNGVCRYVYCLGIIELTG